MLLNNKVVVVTAANRGIGYSIVKKCAENGAIVYMAARDEENAKIKIAEFCNNGYNVKFVYNNALEKQSFVTMIEEVVSNEGRIDGLVNNFGTSNPKLDKGIESTDYRDFISCIDKNLASVFISCQEAIKYMKKTGGGSIVNISSIGGELPDISQISYGVSKAAINHMSNMIALQEARNNIRCNVVAPGMTATDSVKDNLSDYFKEIFLKNTPIKRMAEPDEIAAAVVYFLSDYSAYTTGQKIAVSGGFGLGTPIFGDMAEFLNNR